MYDKDLIQRVCELTCTKDDVVGNASKLKYETEHPFVKYYSFNSIKGAIEKFISNEWDDKTLAHWACIYCWILLGGCNENITENLNSFERFLRDVITWDLDGLSFFNAEYMDEDIKSMYETIQLFENYDYVWQTRNSWKAVYAMIGPFDRHNGDQYVALINHISKEYMIIYSGYLKNGVEDKHFKFVTQEDFIKLMDGINADGYSMLSCAEDHYYAELEDL